MRIPRLRSAVLAVTLGAGLLAGAAPALAATQTGAAVAAGGWPTRDWYLQGPYPTMAACDLAYEDAAQNGQYTGLLYCHWFRGGGPYMPGFYYEVYIP
ncbi:hypothetical protein [Streptosporangium pseudovulgare]|uniref:Secreted protein n=1 Tax=Streptosporangium pseudovulgare TaxID=35765 RepID=A0ABQ2R9M7_9ACTN|nr:hypothetical protein [Streptosporangium pseudovulgare]GGQ15810.1 hypothetical protein GCM10010140_52630 [Streptosporangium pseudovulgare]